MRKIFYKILVIAGVVFLAGNICSQAFASVLTIRTDVKQIPQESTFTVDIRLDSEKTVVNAVQARVTYDPHALEFIEVSKTDSALTLWAEEPKVDISAGVVTFTGGIPNGSYVIDGRILQIVFRAKTLGMTNVSIDGGTAGVYLNDGLGTKSSLRIQSLYFEIVVPTATLALTSISHPDENKWYAKSNVNLSWSPTKDAVYAFLLATDATELPNTQLAKVTSETTFTEQTDGAYTFVIQEKSPNDNWSAAVRRRVLIDTTQPEVFSPQLTKDVVPGKLVLIFQAQDLTSGISHYEIQEGDSPFTITTSPYVLRDQHQHSDLTIRALDKAGNIRVAYIPAAAETTTPLLIWIVVAGAGAVLVVGVIFWRARRKK